jgi:hypothetical protein
MDNVLAILFLAAVFGIFKPYIGSLKRKHFAVAAIVLFIAFGASLPDPKKGSVPGKQAEAPKEASAAPPKVDKLALVQSFQSSVFDRMKPCDEAASDLAKLTSGLADGRGSIYDGYSAAKRTENACRQSWSDLSDLEAPAGLSDKGNAKAKETIETCTNAVLAKQMAASQMAEIFDGNMRPSAVEDAKQKAEAAQMGILACAAGVFVVASEEGVDVAKLKITK